MCLLLNLDLDSRASRMSLSEHRPDPDQLLAKVKEQESHARRGKLRIYFGSSAGVGKTYAMLDAAGKALTEGRDVVVGVVETHGRAETAALLEGLPTIPLKSVPIATNS
jgi:two-component system sensor histidine kinase KdpD